LKINLLTFDIVTLLTHTTMCVCVVQYYYECYCADTYDRLGSADNCNTSCAGNQSQICGGAGALSVYSGAFHCDTGLHP